MRRIPALLAIMTMASALSGRRESSSMNALLSADKTYNWSPIVGVLTEDYNATHTYLSASYVKWLESAGARVVPVLVDMPQNYYHNMFNVLNGLLLPGGGVSLYRSGYASAAKIFFDLAVSSPSFFPIWGTCLGFEQLVLLANEDRPDLTPCSAENEPQALIPTKYFNKSRIVRDMSDEIREILIETNATANFHQNCLSPASFSSFNMSGFWREPLALGRDESNASFVALLEARKKPIWAVQFHPEKVAYEWKNLRIPRGRNNVRAAAFFADFFVEQTRHSANRFQSKKQENKALIYNHNAVFTGKQGGYFTQTYFFKIGQ